MYSDELLELLLSAVSRFSSEFAVTYMTRKKKRDANKEEQNRTLLLALRKASITSFWQVFPTVKNPAFMLILVQH